MKKPFQKVYGLLQIRKIHFLSGMFFLLALLPACELAPCADLIILPEELYIDVLDSSGYSLLLNQTYDADSIQLSNKGMPIEFRDIYYDSLLVILEWDFDLSNELIINWNSTDSDTLQMTYYTEERTCSTEYIPNKVIHRGMSLAIEEYDGNHKIQIIR